MCLKWSVQNGDDYTYVIRIYHIMVPLRCCIGNYTHSLRIKEYSELEVVAALMEEKLPDLKFPNNKKFPDIHAQLMLFLQH